MNRFKCPACGGNQYTSADTAEGRIYCGHRVNVIFYDGHAFVIIKDGDGLERIMSMPIYYCPMCGRKLS